MNDEMTVYGSGLLAPVASLEEMKAAYDAKQAFVDSLMVSGQDYGSIPGTRTKPTLLKPGAEKIAKLYGARVVFDLVDFTEDWTGVDHGGEPFFYYRYRCDWIKNGEVIAASEASCNSWEEKYRYRTAKPTCPICGEELRKSKNDPGYYCWIKTGGCGATFGPDVMEGQTLGKIPNPNPADVVNTIQKMGQKRAMVANALIVGDMSDIFTQDLEDRSGSVIDGSFVDVDPNEGPQPGPIPAATKAAARKKAAAGKTPASQKATGTPGLDAIFDQVVAEGLSENFFSAKSSLEKCRTGYDTKVKAVAWMKLYRGWRDLGKSSDEAADLANAGEVPS